MVEAHFENIRNLISGKIKEAKSDIKIAVAWFTQKELFSELLGALNRGVNVSLIIIKDFINCGLYGLPLQNFIDAGGRLHFVSDRSWTMHNKFCLFDNRIVITGSYNWTYSAETRNAENVILTDDESVCHDYNVYFSMLWDSSQEECKIPKIEICPDDVIEDFAIIHDEIKAMENDNIIPISEALEVLNKAKTDSDVKIAMLEKPIMPSLKPIDQVEPVCFEGNPIKPGECVLLKTIALPIYYNEHWEFAQRGDSLPIKKEIYLQNATFLEDGTKVFSIEKLNVGSYNEVGLGSFYEKYDVLKFKGLPKQSPPRTIQYYMKIVISKTGFLKMTICCQNTGRWRAAGIQLIENEDFLIGK